MKSWPPEVGRMIKVRFSDKEHIGRVKLIASGEEGALIYEPNNNQLANYNEKLRDHFLLFPSHSWEYIDGSKPQTPVTESVSKNLIINLTSSIDENLLKKSESDKKPEIPHGGKLRDDGKFTDTIYTDFNRKSIDNELDKNFLSKDGSPDFNYLFKNSFEISDDTTNCFQPGSEIMDALKKKLLAFEELKPDEISSASLSYSILIKSNDDEKNEGLRIINWIKERLNNDYREFIGGASLQMFIDNGYVVCYRNGCKTTDEITDELLIRESKTNVTSPVLKNFDWQYGKPIDYNTLKYVIFNNDFQKGLINDQAQLEEAKKILSQEYIIALHPDPRYQLWCVKRLLLAWYADNELWNNIRKIKILINQFRGRSDADYNNQHGVLPSIIVYPKYGVTSALTVKMKLGEYFYTYLPLGWDDSLPSYFRQINKLIYYTNGLMDLKKYFRNVSHHSNGSIIEDVFNNTYTNIDGFNDPYDKIGNHKSNLNMTKDEIMSFIRDRQNIKNRLIEYNSKIKI